MKAPRLLAALLAATALGSVAAIAADRDPVIAQPSDKPEYGTFGFDIAGMDRKVAPGDDFDSFANGGWRAATPIPDDKASVDMFTVLNDRALEDTRVILEELKAQPSSKSGLAYASFMDEAALNAAGLKPLKPWLDSVKAVKTKADYATLAGRAQRINGTSVMGPVGIGVGVDQKDPSKYTVTIAQSGLALPDRDYYLVDSEAFTKARAGYQAHIAKMFTLAGEADATARAGRVLAFETELAKVHWTRVDSRDADKTYNRMTVADFVKSAPGFDWGRFFAATGIKSDALVVRQPSALVATAKLIEATPVETLKDVMLAQTLDGYAQFLPAAFDDERFAFFQGQLSGIPQQQPRWKRAVAWTGAVLGEDVGKIYVERHFPPATKAAMDDLVANVIKAMDTRLQGLEWMAPETKVKARAKLAAFTPKIGYPTKWRDYSALDIRAGDLVGNAMRAREFEFERKAKRLGGPVDRDEWFMTPMTINAYANPTFNEIVFPAAILQPPYFDPNADPAVNYGGIGGVIGHEISHHFDDQGRKYDASGKLTEWWTADDVTRFKALTDKLVTQYSAYEPLPGEKVNGQLTLGENIGDLAGLTVAYEAYKASLKGKPAPVIDGFTGDQRFYLGWAQVWRDKTRDAALLRQIKSDPHSPAPLRAQVVRNLDAWYAAYQPKAGQKLFLAPADRVRIW